MQLVIISGPPGAGKSAAADALCERYDRMLHLDMAKLRDFLCMGRLRPWDGSTDGLRQRELFIASACDLSRRFLDGGYGVVIDDVVTPDTLPLYQRHLADRATAVHFVVLLPGGSILRARRPAEGRNQERLEDLYERFATWRDVAVVEPGSLAPGLIADRVMALAAEGRALLSNPPLS